MENNNKNKNQNQNNITQTILGILIALTFSYFVWSMLFQGGMTQTSDSYEIAYNEFLEKNRILVYS